MKGELDCVPCIVRQMLETARLVTPDSHVHEQVLREIIHYLDEADWNISPMELSTGAYEIVHHITGNADPYRAIKQEQNRVAMSLLEEMRRMVERSGKDRLHTAAKLAVVGNVIDCGTGADHDVVKELQHGMELPMAIDAFVNFKQQLSKAKKILYVCDNAGEIVFDRVFMEEIKHARPEAQLIACVRGGPMLNDATREDAEVVGLKEVATIIDTGTAAVGIPLGRISKELRRLIEGVDIIISKGQGNFESLDELEDGRIFFILRAKCPLIARKFGVRLRAIIFANAIKYAN